MKSSVNNFAYFINLYLIKANILKGVILETINIKILTPIVKLEKFAKFILSSKYIDDGKVLKINNMDVIKLFLKLRSSNERTMEYNKNNIKKNTNNNADE